MVPAAAMAAGIEAARTRSSVLRRPCGACPPIRPAGSGDDENLILNDQIPGVVGEGIGCRADRRPCPPGRHPPPMHRSEAPPARRACIPRCASLCLRLFVLSVVVCESSTGRPHPRNERALGQQGDPTGGSAATAACVPRCADRARLPRAVVRGVLPGRRWLGRRRRCRARAWVRLLAARR